METHHALNRLDGRLLPEEQGKVLTEIRKAANQYGGESLGVIAYRLPHQRGNAWSNGSNGDFVVAIIRQGQLVTAYLRRGSQTFDTDVTRTRTLVDMTGAILSKPMFAR